MNVDFFLNATPAMARKIVAASLISRVDVDERIRELATKGLLSIPDIKQFIPEKMADKIDASTLHLAQHAADHDYRFPLITKGKFNDGMMMLMLAALSSGKNVVAIETNKRNFASFAKEYLDDYVVVKEKGEQQFDYDSRVIIIPESKIDGEFISKTRDRVLVQYSVSESWDSNYSWSIFTDGAEYHSEYPHFISGTHGLRGAWSTDYFVVNIIREFYPTINVTNLLMRATTKSIQANLTGMGFTGKTPEDMATLLGVYLNV